MLISPEELQKISEICQKYPSANIRLKKKQCAGIGYILKLYIILPDHEVVYEITGVDDW